MLLPLHLPVTYDDLKIYLGYDHETKSSGFEIGLYDHLPCQPLWMWA